MILQDGSSKLQSIFRSGLIGTSEKDPDIERSGFFNQTNAEKYVKTLRSKLETDVFFSIIGRSRNDFAVPIPPRFRKISQYWGNLNTICVVFDLSSFDEVKASREKR